MDINVNAVSCLLGVTMADQASSEQIRTSRISTEMFCDNARHLKVIDNQLRISKTTSSEDFLSVFSDEHTVLSTLPSDLYPTIDRYIKFCPVEVIKLNSIMEKYKHINISNLPKPDNDLLIKLAKDCFNHKHRSLTEKEVFVLATFADFDFLDSFFCFTHSSATDALLEMNNRNVHYNGPDCKRWGSGQWLYRNSSIKDDAITSIKHRSVTLFEQAGESTGSQFCHFRVSFDPRRGYTCATSDLVFKSALEMLLTLPYISKLELSQFFVHKDAKVYIKPGYYDESTQAVEMQKIRRYIEENQI